MKLAKQKMCSRHEKIENKIIMNSILFEIVSFWRCSIQLKKQIRVREKKKLREFTNVRFHGNSFRKPWQHSWENGEIIALIEAKK
jgi:hypothetical protein